MVERVGAAGGEEVEPVLVDTRAGGSLKDSKAFGFDAGPAGRAAGLSRP
ncbi:transcriptional regulator [Streptomyces sp. GMY01]|nr:transcriptional regulator [Streptomyces sp. GMY02]